MLWSRQRLTFAVEAYCSNNRSVIAVQRAFSRPFDIPPRVPVPVHKSVLMRMDSPRATRNLSKEKNEPPKNIRTTENVERVRSMSIHTGI
ncbi:hypothetical protein TNCV_120511 [Trichonephila clavipes]|nr:hypothetical protein TNCV_120511 [Trichonephila clavipes]